MRLFSILCPALLSLGIFTVACGAPVGGEPPGGEGGEGGSEVVDAAVAGTGGGSPKGGAAGNTGAGGADGSLADARSSDGGAPDRERDARTQETASMMDADISPDAPIAAKPTLASEFVAGEKIWKEANRSTGTLTFAAKNASAADDAVVELMVPGNPAYGPADHATPAYANEISTLQTLSFGTFRARVQLATCKPTEELVNGIFTYFNDGQDHNGNGIPDNSEIDIEVLCSNPAKLSLTSWIDYAENPEKFIKKGRMIDFATGDYYEDVADNGYEQAKVGNSPDFKHPGFPDPNAFYELGFEWHAKSIRYFIVVDGREITLWNMTEEKYVPKLPAKFLFNLWHAQTDWWTGKDSDYPSANATMRIDWFRYWKD